VTTPDDTTPDYPTGALKRSPDGRAFAVKNELRPDGWSVMTVDQGGHNTTLDEVKDWPDVPVSD
jgi:hypothetical protein